MVKDVTPKKMASAYRETRDAEGVRGQGTVGGKGNRTSSAHNKSTGFPMMGASTVGGAVVDRASAQGGSAQVTHKH